MTFHYHRPTTTAAALRLLGPGSCVLAGGQSLVPALRRRERRPSHLVDIAAVRGELGSVQVRSDALAVGAGVRQQELVDRAPAGHDALVEALRRVGNHVVRRNGTVVGIVAHADPGCQLAAVCGAVGATAVAESLRGVRRIPAWDLFRAAARRRPDELVTGLEFPAPAPGSASAFRQVSLRRAGGPHLVSVAARIVLADGWCTDAAVAAAVPGQGCAALTRTADALVGTRVHAEDIATELVEGEIALVDDGFATAAYRYHALRALVRGTVLVARSRAEGVR
ncbi:FAD binding domain-containing protein [Saccharopolyspora rosea]|uniref:FAD binding domain-containing protein n=1 Tax=Saccharopolyspora rosea TaxID=524884 RepID=A0ABW3G4K4_9PSEU|nr:FAD binding domain-containing protein [Saccharopolyspora rosea]